MKRNCNINEISDGKLYNINDLVQVSCNGCKGGADCCHGMGKSIVLDPYDIFRLTTNLNLSFEQLLVDKLELNIVDGLILPNLKMLEISEQCAYLNKNGRCSIHSVRPGICRIFPLGRYYEDHSFQYILQVKECPNNSNTKVKVCNWIDTPDIIENQKFINEWHYLLKDIEKQIQKIQDEKVIKNINMYILKSFYLKPYESNKDFYKQFQDRLHETKEILTGI